jgi:septal ring factor EnvC (AmiA/AmiB activator)
MMFLEAQKIKMKIIQKQIQIKPATRSAAVLVVSLVFLAATFVPQVRALSNEEIQSQINALNADKSQKQQSVDTLLLEAKGYEDAIATLQAQINDLQSKINENLALQAKVQAEIVKNQQELEKQKHVLGEDIKSMYVDGRPSSLEMLASSSNLSDFVDKEVYRTSVQNKIQEALKKIAKLQSQLKEQEAQVSQLLSSQKAQQDQIAQNRARQNELLSYNQSQRDAFNKEIKASQSKIDELQRLQAALNARGSSKVFITGDERGGACDGG